MHKVKLKPIFPKRSDYPDNLEILDANGSSAAYRQIAESSASAYFETNFLARYFFKKRFQLTLELIDNAGSGFEILDAGCGIGFFLPSLTPIAKNIWAIDFAKYSLKYAKAMCKKRKMKKIHFKQIDLTRKLPFPAKKFDFIIFLSVFEHIKNLRKVALNLKRVLKKDGILIAGYPNEDNPIFRLFQLAEKKLLRPNVYKTFQGTKLIHVSYAHQITAILSKNFKIEKTVNISLLPGINFYILKKCKL
jgi:2-polyprenyl-3-methyl-5-hydroxy-6-metoxy-1,4-benzoquinol methylase